MEQVRERQRAMLSTAAEQRHAHRVKRLGRAARRAERAERQLSRSWSQAAQRRDELTRLAAEQWD
jgi:hypothetical protein